MSLTPSIRNTVVSALLVLIFVFAELQPALAKDMCRDVNEAQAAQLQNRKAVVTDIDGVLTGYVLQDYGPTNGAFVDQGVAYARPDAALMINIYQRLGYVIVYMAGRPRQLDVLDKTMCQATLDWLEVNGFPIQQGQTLLLLRDGAKEVVDAKNRGLAMANWMGDNGTNLFVSMTSGVASEFNLTPLYGYVDSDVITDAFIDLGVPAEHIFTIGNKGISRLGYRGSQAIVGPEPNPGYTNHISEFIVPQVPEVQ